eukprot:1690803-Rhodomonas_salina.1
MGEGLRRREERGETAAGSEPHHDWPQSHGGRQRVAEAAGSLKLTAHPRGPFKFTGDLTTQRGPL